MIPISSLKKKKYRTINIYCIIIHYLSFSFTLATPLLRFLMFPRFVWSLWPLTGTRIRSGCFRTFSCLRIVFFGFHLTFAFGLLTLISKWYPIIVQLISWNKIHKIALIWEKQDKHDIVCFYTVYFMAVYNKTFSQFCNITLTVIKTWSVWSNPYTI